MENKKEKNVDNLGTVEHCRGQIVDIVDKINDERFLRRIYISLREYATEKGLE